MSFFHRHIWLSGIAVAGLVVAIVFKAIVDVAGDEVAGIGGEFKNVALSLRLWLVDVGAALWGIRCWLYTMRWKLKARSLHNIFNTVVGVLLIASISVVIEITLSAVRLLSEPKDPSVPKHLATLPLFTIPHFHPPLWLEATLLILSLLMVRHHWIEWKVRRQNFETPQIAARLLLDLDRIRVPGSNICTPEKRDEFLEQLMVELKGRLGCDDNKKVEFSIMVPDGRGELVTFFIHPSKANIQSTLVLKEDEGAAGAAFRTGQTIYVPSTKHRMGINVDTNKTMNAVFKPEPTPTEMRCLLCAPIFHDGKVSGVLNIVSTKRSSFSSFQMGIGRLMAAIISTVD